jgi:hypothetical protein
MVTSVVRLEATDHPGKTPEPTRFTGCTMCTGFGGDAADKYFYFFLSSRDLSRISLRYDTVPVYGSISNEITSSTKSRRAQDLCAGKTTYRSTQLSEVTEVKKRRGNTRGHKCIVGEAFADRRDTKPQELEDGTTSFEMGYQLCDNYT